MPGLGVACRDGGEDVKDGGGDVLWFFIVEELDRERFRQASEGACDKVGDVFSSKISWKVGVAEDYRREIVVDCVRVPAVEDYHFDPVCVCGDKAFQGEEEGGESGVERE